ncbi:MAG: aryl-sulfate sulfotransferase [Flavobacteriales bacterium]
MIFLEANNSSNFVRQHTIMKMMKVLYTLFASFLTIALCSQTVGTVELNSQLIEEGYTLMAPLGHNSTYLINNCGEVVNRWESQYSPGNEVFITEEGNLWRAGQVPGDGLIGTGGRGGIIELFNWEGQVIWSYERCSTEECMHHDFKLLPNGNLLILVWDAYTYEEAVAQGGIPEDLSANSGVWSEYLVEIEPNLEENNSATEVWQWHVWDHLVQDHDDALPNFGVVAEEPGKINLNYVQFTQPDWLHANGIDYNTELDQIIMSVPHFDEFWIIDHSLTQEEAATDAGDLIYRWGNPSSYGNGNEEDVKLYFQHNPHWIPSGMRHEGKIMVFNNQVPAGDSLSSNVIILDPELDEFGNYQLSGSTFGPEVPSYEFQLPPELMSRKVSGAQMQPNDNLLICSGSNGTILEITEQEEVVWQYKIPINDLNEYFEQGDDPAGHIKWLFRAYKYSPDYEGFEDKDLSPGLPIETNGSQSFCVVNSIADVLTEKVSIYPNPVLDALSIDSENGINHVVLLNSTGSLVWELDRLESSRIDMSDLNSGIYYLQLTLGSGQIITSRVIKL